MTAFKPPQLQTPSQSASCVWAGSCVCTQMGFFQYSWIVINCKTSVCSPAKPSGKGWSKPCSPFPKALS